MFMPCSTNGAANPGPAAEPRSLVKYRHQQGFASEGGAASSRLSQALMRKKEAREIKPDYHAQCMSPSVSRLAESQSDLCLGKLTRVISGHMGWVRAVAVDPGNQWFATGAGDRVVKVGPEFQQECAGADLVNRSGTWRPESSNYHSPVTFRPFVVWASRTDIHTCSRLPRTKW